MIHDSTVIKVVKKASSEAGINDELLTQILGFSIDEFDNRSLEKLVVGRLLSVLNSLNTLSGGNTDFMNHWLFSENQAFNHTKPSDLMKSKQGLHDVDTYLKIIKSN